jgi:hypothetical protein
VNSKTLPRVRTSDALAEIATKGCLAVLLSVLAFGCVSARSAHDRVRCAENDFAACRKVADVSDEQTAIDVLRWACERGDGAACFRAAEIGWQCEPKRCPNTESVDAGVISVRSCREHLVEACEFATKLGHRSALVAATERQKIRGIPAFFLDDRHLVTTDEEGWLLWRFDADTSPAFSLVETRPLVQQPSAAPRLAAGYRAVHLSPSAEVRALVDLNEGYLWRSSALPERRFTKLGPLKPPFAFSDDGRVLLGCTSRDGLEVEAVLPYDTDGLRLLGAGVRVPDAPRKLIASKNTYGILSRDGVTVVDLRSSTSTFLKSKGLALDVAFSRDGGLLALSGEKGLDLYGSSWPVRPLRSRSGWFKSLAFSPDETLLAAETKTGVSILDPRSLGEASPEIQISSVPYPNQSYRLLFNPSGSLLIVHFYGDPLVVRLKRPARQSLAPVRNDPVTWFGHLPSVARSDLFELSREHDRTFAGRVVAGNGVPVDGAVVQLTPKPDNIDLRFPEVVAKLQPWLDAQGMPQTITDAEGRYRFERLARLRWEVAATHSSWVAAHGEAYLVDRDENDFELRLWAGARISGRVKLQSGEPAVGFRVVATQPTRSMSEPIETVTGADGTYAFDRIRPSPDYVVLEAIGPNAEAARAIVEPRVAGELPVDMTALPFESAELARLVAVDEAGAPLAGVRVNRNLGNDRTNSSGRWSAAISPATVLSVSYRGKSFRASRETTGGPQIVRLPTAELFVRHPPLKPGMGFALVRTTERGAERAELISEAAGTRFPRVNAGRWTLWHIDAELRLGNASLELAPQQALTVAPPAGTESGIRAAGRVIDAKTRKPIFPAEIQVSCFDVPASQPLFPIRKLTLETDPAGRFVVPCFSRAIHRVIVKKPRFIERRPKVDLRRATDHADIGDIEMYEEDPDAVRRALRAAAHGQSVPSGGLPPHVLEEIREGTKPE